jgi:hypothetical protein
MNGVIGFGVSQSDWHAADLWRTLAMVRRNFQGTFFPEIVHFFQGEVKV